MLTNMITKRLHNFLIKARQISSIQSGFEYEQFQKFINDYHKIQVKSVTNLKEKLKNFISQLNKFEGLEAKKVQDRLVLFKKQFCKIVNNEIRTKLNWWEREAFEILATSKEANFLEYFGNQETHYRDFLVWLLSPYGSHNFGYKFTNIFVNHIATKYGDHRNNYKPLSERHFTSVEVKREYLGIDFIINGKEFYCAVEMKLMTNEHGDQLTKYVRMLEKDSYYKTKNRKFWVFLDPKVDPGNPCKLSCVEFKPMDWWELIKLLVELYERIPESFNKTVVGNFITQILSEPIKYFHNKREILDKIWKLELTLKNGGNNVGTDF